MKQLQQAMNLFQIGDPIKSLFRPIFQLEDSFDRAELFIRMSVSAPDALERPKEAHQLEGRVRVNVCKLVPPRLLHAEIYDTDHYNLLVAQYLREILHTILIHEADESITVNGRKIFDPHKNDQPPSHH